MFFKLGRDIMGIMGNVHIDPFTNSLLRDKSTILFSAYFADVFRIDSDKTAVVVL